MRVDSAAFCAALSEPSTFSPSPRLEAFDGPDIASDCEIVPLSVLWTVPPTAPVTFPRPNWADAGNAVKAAAQINVAHVYLKEQCISKNLLPYEEQLCKLFARYSLIGIRLKSRYLRRLMRHKDKGSRTGTFCRNPRKIAKCTSGDCSDLGYLPYVEDRYTLV
jgi:hypothetical protein